MEETTVDAGLLEIKTMSERRDVGKRTEETGQLNGTTELSRRRRPHPARKSSPAWCYIRSLHFTLTTPERAFANLLVGYICILMTKHEKTSVELNRKLSANLPERT